MIWLFHKVDLKAPTPQWVTVDFFLKKMREIQNRGLVVVPLSKYRDPLREVVLTFDGVYENIYWYAFPILKKYNYPFELFVTGKFSGQLNDFDWPEPETRFADWIQLKEMAKSGGVLEYHSWSHRDLVRILDEAELEREIYPPFPAAFFAYPYGRFNQRVKTIVSKYYQGAVSVYDGDNSPFELIREPVWDKSALLFPATITGRIWRKLLRVFWRRPASR